MQSYQREFIEFAIEKGVLKFGEFTLKSGRTSPYFFNAGLFNTGDAIAKLGRFYAAAIENAKIRRKANTQKHQPDPRGMWQSERSQGHRLPRCMSLG